MLKYWILVTRNEQGAIVSLFSPDLNKELFDLEETRTESYFDFRSYLRRKLSEELEAKNKIIVPKRHAQFTIELTPLQFWESFKIKPNKKNRIFERCLPTTGYILNVIAILTNLFITFMALKIASQNEQDSTKSTALSLAGSIFNSLVNYFVYVISGASEALIETGYHLDNRFFRKQDTDFTEDSGIPLTKKHICKFISLSLIAGGCILTNTLIGGIRQYQEFILLTKKYLELDPGLSDTTREQYYQLIKTLVIFTNIFATSYCAIAFQGSFARKLITTYFDKKNKIISSMVGSNHLESDRLIDRKIMVPSETDVSIGTKHLEARIVQSDSRHLVL